MTFGSLFAGIGGIDLGLEKSGMECIWQVENNPYAIKILEKHWPNIHREIDVKECGKHNLEKVDLICGGFPCQDLSYAGKRAGIKGSRSGLWFEFARIICELRPQYVLVENVPGLLSAGMGRVLGDLAESGYDAEWNRVSAASVGAPHLRERIFIVAYTKSERANRRSEEVCQTYGRSRRTLFGESERPSDVANTAEQGLEREIAEGEFSGRKSGLLAECDWWAVEPDVGRVAYGVPKRVDRLKCLGNAIVPQVAEFVGRCIMNSIKPTC